MKWNELRSKLLDYLVSGTVNLRRILMTSVILALELALGFSCPKTLVFNKTDTWVEHDNKSMKVAAKRCPQIYKRSPCLKVFIKKGFQDYNAICGHEIENNE
jgi:hypothetical protein